MGTYRPVKQRFLKQYTTGIDSRTNTRKATDDEKRLATLGLQTLENERNVIGLVPAPDPHFEGHKIRVQLEQNPAWYRDYNGGEAAKGHRDRVVRALVRVAQKGRVRGNGSEVQALEYLRKHFEQEQPSY